MQYTSLENQLLTPECDVRFSKQNDSKRHMREGLQSDVTTNVIIHFCTSS